MKNTIMINSMIELEILAGNQKSQKARRSQHTPDSQTETIVIIGSQILSATHEIKTADENQKQEGLIMNDSPIHSYRSHI